MGIFILTFIQQYLEVEYKIRKDVMDKNRKCFSNQFILYMTEHGSGTERSMGP